MTKSATSFASGAMRQSPGVNLKTETRQSLGVRQLESLDLLMKSLPELRSELVAAISENPVIEDLDHPLEMPLSSVERSCERRESESTPDYPDDGYVPDLNRDESAAERRQAFFDNQVKQETLQEHLVRQLSLSDIPRRDWPLVEMLVGDLDDNGFYRGSMPDACMAAGRSPEEVRATLKKITALDPPGCGAVTAAECLLAQLDSLDGSPYQDDVRKMIESHLSDIAAGRFDTVARALGMTRRQYVLALKELRTLNARPGAAFPGERDRIEYVNPEIHAVNVDGRWNAFTDGRSLPEIRIAKKYLDLLKDSNQSEETKAYILERIESAKRLRDAVMRRQETVEGVAQCVFDRQQEFFSKGFASLRPLTETEVAKSVGVDVSTVSRTVRGKYVATPFGTVELRRFFAAPVKTADGTAFSQADALGELSKIVASEDRQTPLSDGAIAKLMGDAGFSVARRTVAKYREQLGIPAVAGRKSISGEREK